MKTTKAKVLSEFTDAGTGQRYIAGDTPDIESGAFANYEAAGLVEKQKPETKADSKPAA